MLAAGAAGRQVGGRCRRAWWLPRVFHFREVFGSSGSQKNIPGPVPRSSRHSGRFKYHIGILLIKELSSNPLNFQGFKPLSMASSDFSDDDFLESVEVSVEEANLTLDADTHASVTGIFAQISPDRMVELIGIDLPRVVGPKSISPALSVSRRWLYLQAPNTYARFRRGELTATQTARFTLLLLFASTFWSNRKEHFNPSILKSLENLAHLKDYDWAGAILSRMYDDMCGLSRSHCKFSGTYYFWETWAYEYFPFTRPELVNADLGLGLVPLAWRWYRPNLHTVQHKKSLKDLRAFFDTCSLAQATRPLHPDLVNLRLPYSIPYYVPDSPPSFREVSLENIDRATLPSEDINEVPDGLVNQMMELVLGMQQELITAGTQMACDNQRRRRPRH
ncbi:hypothetical protein JCGZ_19208 [Jatropha curcas]|uniref:Aminotransferase-like plant mobile domain-containing protein n=1 Tax=Jatropha curcas TaxID=180498 RepID=A0A067L7B5_JATCU|nr:hypothetical protein JCGZ_19208 [Jatropha curcas]